MPLSPTVSTWFERFFPGITSEIQKRLGQGSFSDRPVRCTPHGNDGIKAIRLELQYSLKDGHLLKVEQRLALKKCPPGFTPGVDTIDLADWEPITYRLWYGRKLEDSLFRFELHELTPGGRPQHHVHVTFPQRADHIPAVDFDPDTTNMDPRAFVQLVERYRIHRIYPVVRKPKS